MADELEVEIPEDLPDEEIEIADDAGGEDETEGDADEGLDEENGAEEEVAPAARLRARAPASETIRREKAEKKAAQEEAAALRREIAEVRAAQQRAPSQADLERARQIEAERLALMTPDERIDYRFEQQQRQFEQQRQADRMQMAEMGDVAAFKSLQASDPLAKKYAAEVEKLVASQKAIGIFTSRDIALDVVVGRAIRERGAKALAGDKKAAGARVAAATGRPGRATGDQGSDRSSRRAGDESEAALERRLGNVKF